MNKRFQPYPQRQIRLEDEVWEEFKKNKDKTGGTWNSFIKSINQRIKGDEVVSSKKQ